MSGKLTTNHPQTRVFRTEELQIVDKHGNVRGRFGVKDDGSPRLQLEQDGTLAELELYPNGSVSLVLKSAGREDVHVELGIDASGEGAVIVGDKYGGASCVRLGLNERGAPVIEAVDKASESTQVQIN